MYLYHKISVGCKNPCFGILSKMKMGYMGLLLVGMDSTESGIRNTPVLL